MFCVLRFWKEKSMKIARWEIVGILRGEQVQQNMRQHMPKPKRERDFHDARRLRLDAIADAINRGESLELTED
jgi:predicted acylesterase/phospholipase RssA